MDLCLTHPPYVTSVETEAYRQKGTFPRSPRQSGSDQEDLAQTPNLEIPAWGPLSPSTELGARDAPIILVPKELTGRPGRKARIPDRKGSGS